MVGEIFVDTTILLAGLIDMGGASAPAQRILDAIADGRVDGHTAWHCCLEFFAVSTRLPEELRLNPSDAVRLVEHEILDRFRVHQLPASSMREFMRATLPERVAGGRIYDAHIAEIARRTGARTVVTDNARHFSSLLRHGVRVVSGKELAALLNH